MSNLVGESIQITADDYDLRRFGCNEKIVSGGFYKINRVMNIQGKEFYALSGFSDGELVKGDMFILKKRPDEELLYKYHALRRELSSGYSSINSDNSIGESASNFAIIAALSNSIL